MAGGKRNRLQGGPPKWAVVRGMLHMRLKDVAAELNVPITYLRRLCHQNGFPNWPGKRIRYLKSTGKNLMQEVDEAESSSRARLAGPSQLTKHDDDMTGPPREELVTLNLIEKVGSSSSGERS